MHLSNTTPVRVAFSILKVASIDFSLQKSVNIWYLYHGHKFAGGPCRFNSNKGGKHFFDKSIKNFERWRIWKSFERYNLTKNCQRCKLAKVSIFKISFFRHLACCPNKAYGLNWILTNFKKFP